MSLYKFELLMNNIFWFTKKKCKIVILINSIHYTVLFKILIFDAFKAYCGNMLNFLCNSLRRTLMVLHIQTFDMNIKYYMHF